MSLRSALAAPSLSVQGSKPCRVPCGSGFTREEDNAVYGTGAAGVRG
ncbi:hypothetical protein LOY24_18920 [Pseudomonas putida]|nr:hypothetical protein [Pseudomonas putida]UVL76793.1 hypothetical protein LOY24_18920 [Pseudomonas putida]